MLQTASRLLPCAVFQSSSYCVNPSLSMQTSFPGIKSPWWCPLGLITFHFFIFPWTYIFFQPLKQRNMRCFFVKMNGHINPFFSINWKAKMSLYLMPGQCFSVLVFLESFTCSQCIVKVIIQSKCLFLQMNI